MFANKIEFKLDFMLKLNPIYMNKIGTFLYSAGQYLKFLLTFQNLSQIFDWLIWSYNEIRTKACLERLNKAHCEGSALGDFLEHLCHFKVSATHQSFLVNPFNVVTHLKNYNPSVKCKCMQIRRFNLNCYYITLPLFLVVL